MCRSAIVAIILSLSVLSSCASLPDATVRYYLPQTKLNIRVIRTVSCDATNQLVIANAVTPASIHIADPTQQKHVALSDLRGPFSDSDVKFGFYDDGRLKDFNASSSGQGEAILKTVIQLAPLFFAFDGGTSYPKECAEIKKAGGDKPLTITYAGDVNPTSQGISQIIKPEPTSQLYADTYASVIGTVCATVGPPIVPTEPPVKVTTRGAVLELREPATLHVKVFAGGSGKCTEGPAWEGDMLVAQLGKPYHLPIPKPVLFGKELLAASFAESGALTSVQFTSNSGAGQLLNVANAAETAAKPETPAQKAADVKAEADLIAQQQRLVQCVADPKGCK